MTVELAKFLVVISVVMVGFAMSFYALSRGDYTFGDTCLNLFKAMLGEVGLSEEFSVLDDDDDCGYVLGSVATLLLVLYLVILTIMLRNLLIAVLSTSHARVAESAERELKVSNTRLIQHYRVVVDRHLLPAPFNLSQLAASSLFMISGRSWKVEAYCRAKRAVGQAVFWLVLCPVGAFEGTLLWVLSGPYSPLTWRRYYLNYDQNSQYWHYRMMSTWVCDCIHRRLWYLSLMYLASSVWCRLGGPLFLYGGLVKTPFLWIMQVAEGSCRKKRLFSQTVKRPNSTVNVHDMLHNAPGGVGASDLRMYLEDPMCDPEVWQDELERLATVEHLKLLRDRFEKNNETLHKGWSSLEARLRNVEEEI